MNSDMLLYLVVGAGALFLFIVIAYLIIKNRNQNSEIAQIRKLQQGTKEKSFSLEILYQKLYICDYWCSELRLPCLAELKQSAIQSRS